MKKYRCASFFAGVGGIDLGFSEFYTTIYANEFDKNAIKTFSENFDISVDSNDIHDVNEHNLPDFDIMLAGFPCQAFSVAGYREGFNDRKNRGNLFFELERIFKFKKPRIIFLENVKNLETHDNGNTLKYILNSLHNSKYFVKYKVMNTMEYGNLPQNRERIYIVAFLNEDDYIKFNFPNDIPLNKYINDIIENVNDEKYYYTSSNFKYYDTLKEQILNKDTIYQWRRKYVRENKSNVCPTLTANMGTGGHNVPLILTNNGIRKLTPKECFKFQGFPDSFKLPNIADSHLYKQAGNSVSISVIRRIANEIFKVLE